MKGRSEDGQKEMESRDTKIWNWEGLWLYMRMNKEKKNNTEDSQVSENKSLQKKREASVLDYKTKVWGFVCVQETSWNWNARQKQKMKWRNTGDKRVKDFILLEKERINNS